MCPSYYQCQSPVLLCRHLSRLVLKPFQCLAKMNIYSNFKLTIFYFDFNCFVKVRQVKFSSSH